MTEILSGPTASVEVHDPSIQFDPERLGDVVAYAREHFPEAVVLQVRFAGALLIAIKLSDGSIVRPAEEGDLS